MTVISLIKKIAQAPPAWAIWPRRLANMVYRYRCESVPIGCPLAVGKKFHNALEDHLNKKRVWAEYFYPCRAILRVLEDLDMDLSSLRCEKPVHQKRLSGRIDLIGKLKDGRCCIIEIKSTLGKFASRPAPIELIQLATYAVLAKAEQPLLVCLRISFKSRRLSVFQMDATELFLQKVRGSMTNANQRDTTASFAR